MRRFTPALSVVVLLLALPASAGAASVNVTGNALILIGGSETNVVALSQASGVYTIIDGSGVPITAGAGCSNPEADQSATCTGGINHLDVNLGGGPDLIDSSSPTLSSLGALSTFRGGDGDDTIIGTYLADDILGDGDNDRMVGGTGSDFFYGGAGVRDIVDYSTTTGPVTVNLAPGGVGDGPASEGDDANRDGTVEGVIGSNQGDTITGSTAANRIEGRVGNDTLSGVDGNDTLVGGDGTDTINGGNDQDIIDGSDPFVPGAPEPDTVVGGAGIDTVSYGGRGDPLRVDLTDPGPDGASGENDAVSQIENVEGGFGSDVLIGDGGPNSLVGNYGDDLLDGRGGTDDFDGGRGDDTATYEGRTAPVALDLGAASPGGGETGEADFFNDIENATGGSGDDTIRGFNGRNSLSGGPGNDTITGLGGVDDIRGGAGNDTIAAGDGDDVIRGDAGSDQVDAGPGEDAVRLRDGEQDTANCGDAFDSVVADSLDIFQNCESVETGAAAAPGGGGPGTGDGPPVPTAADAAKPKIRLGTINAKALKRKAFLKGLPLTLSCDEACSWEVELRGSAKSVRLARYEVTLAQQALARGTGNRKLTVKPSKKLVGKAKKLTVQLRITATDAAGNKTTLTRVLKVR